MREYWLLLLLAPAVLAGSSHATDAAETLTLTYRDGRLTARVEAVPLEDVLAALGRETGAEIRGEVRDWREVTVHFDGVPLPQALDRLLGRQNFTLTYEEGRLVAVDLLGMPQPGTRRPVVATRPTNIHRLLAKHPPVVVGGRLAQALGTDPVRPTRLLRAAARQEDAEVRAEAMDALLSVIEGDQDLLRAVRTTPPAKLATFLRRQAGQRAEEIAGHIAVHAGDQRLRAKMTRTLQWLHRTRTSPRKE